MARIEWSDSWIHQSIKVVIALLGHLEWKMGLGVYCAMLHEWMKIRMIQFQCMTSCELSEGCLVLQIHDCQ